MIHHSRGFVAMLSWSTMVVTIRANCNAPKLTKYVLKCRLLYAQDCDSLLSQLDKGPTITTCVTEILHSIQNSALSIALCKFAAPSIRHKRILARRMRMVS
ncbi:unnamed protein product [Albugo candida]|uniref:Secreted protein n=1 Tax=Albugo candida TaxID=65357 RepID=A0A024FVZ7_9STRA|nr:unnamed protein product [Albugo candida]|eukprot:CCI11338.1 unnamed protein product [Albugo candida]